MWVHIWVMYGSTMGHNGSYMGHMSHNIGRMWVTLVIMWVIYGLTMGDIMGYIWVNHWLYMGRIWVTWVILWVMLVSNGSFYIHGSTIGHNYVGHYIGQMCHHGSCMVRV